MFEVQAFILQIKAGIYDLKIKCNIICSDFSFHAFAGIICGVLGFSYKYECNVQVRFIYCADLVITSDMWRLN